ncbi:hypothetical protein FBY40_3413 [Microbacterium sp. SLBN-154]|nr:hypothetical protein FBY40_3413 [Microbacterium sp. SLBN-154]
MLVVGGLGAAAGILSWVAGMLQSFNFAPLAAFAVLATFGIVRLVRARRERITFEAQHGEAAGKQTPVR